MQAENKWSWKCICPDNNASAVQEAGHVAKARSYSTCKTFYSSANTPPHPALWNTLNVLNNTSPALIPLTLSATDVLDRWCRPKTRKHNQLFFFFFFFRAKFWYSFPSHQVLFHQMAPAVLAPPRPVGLQRAAHTGQQTHHVWLHHVCALTAPHASIHLGGKVTCIKRRGGEGLF